MKYPAGIGSVQATSIIQSLTESNKGLSPHGASATPTFISLYNCVLGFVYTTKYKYALEVILICISYQRLAMGNWFTLSKLFAYAGRYYACR